MNWRSKAFVVAGPFLAAVIAAGPAAAQQYPPPQNPYPPQQQQQQQYPQEQQQQYPQQGQYPPQQGQYPQQGYPPTQYPPTPYGQYPQQQGPYTNAQPPMLNPQQLSQLIAPVALYPDGLLAQVLTASTFYPEIPDASAWANQHSYLHGPALAQAIQSDQLPWDPSVIALLPFPTVLNQMANDMGWTQALGDAVLAQRPQIMDAVQQLRQDAYQYGYLRDNQYDRVVYAPGDIQIVPVQPDYYYVPYYNPSVVFYRPRAGFFVGSAIRFGPGIVIGASFAPWGWGGVHFGWASHSIFIGNRPFVRGWNDRAVFAHGYAAGPHGYVAPHYQEHHDLRGPAHYYENRGGDRGHDRDRDHR